MESVYSVVEQTDTVSAGKIFGTNRRETRARGWTQRKTGRRRISILAEQCGGIGKPRAVVYDFDIREETETRGLSIRGAHIFPQCSAIISPFTYEPQGPISGSLYVTRSRNSTLISAEGEMRCVPTSFDRDDSRIIFDYFTGNRPLSRCERRMNAASKLFVHYKHIITCCSPSLLLLL